MPSTNPICRIFIFGLTAAFLGGLAPSSPIFDPLDRQNSNTKSATDNLFLVHRHSFFNDPFGMNGAKGCASEALINQSFDDEVEDLMDNPW